jgi:hypothetical protein
MQLATLGAVDETTMQQMRTQWSAADTDGSGELSEAEFRIVLAAVADSEWKRVADPSSGRIYYYHQKTKETRWVVPDSGTSSSIAIRCTVRALLRSLPWTVSPTAVALNRHLCIATAATVKTFLAEQGVGQGFDRGSDVL